MTKRSMFKTGVRRRLDAEDVSTGFEDVSTGFEDVSTGFEDVSTGFTDIKSASEKVSSGGEHVSASQREGKDISEEEAKNARREELKRQDELAAKRLQEELELSEAQKKRMAQVQEAAQFYTEEDWDTIQAKLEANADLVKGDCRRKMYLRHEYAQRWWMEISSDKEAYHEELKEKFEYFDEIMERFVPYGYRRKRPESTKSGTKEDVEAYMEERVDEPSSEEFSMSSIPQGPALAKIVKWKIIKTGKRGAYQIIREDNTDVVYVNFPGLLNDLTRDDLKELYSLMMLKYGDNRPEEYFERILNWRYFHSCSVYCLTVEAAHIYMLTEVKYPLPPRVCKAMLKKKLKGDRKDEAKLNDDELWYADYVNYIVGKDEPYEFRLCPDNVMRRCVAGSQILEILAHCHSGPIGGITTPQLLEGRSGNISSRNEMPQNNIQVCEVFDVWGLDFMGPFPNSRVYLYGAVEITNKKGFSFKVNGKRLKKYYGGHIEGEDDEVSIRRIMVLGYGVSTACTGRYGVAVPALHKKPRRIEELYAVSRRLLYTVFYFKYLNILEDIERGPYTKKTPITPY
ncbi:hypothetical protein Tco_0153817 [Tanacetum coccineum]